MMLIWGAADKVAPLAIYQEALSLLGRDTRSVVLENLGHWLMQEDPKAVAEAYINILGSP